MNRGLQEAVLELDEAVWETVCEIDDLTPNVGARVWLNERQVALFRLSGGEELYAIDAIDPFTGAAVLSRGIVGDLRGELVVASPIFKQHFSLVTGHCLEDETQAVRTYAVRVLDGQVQLAVTETV